MGKTDTFYKVRRNILEFRVGKELFISADFRLCVKVQKFARPPWFSAGKKFIRFFMALSVFKHNKKKEMSDKQNGRKNILGYRWPKQKCKNKVWKESEVSR